MLRVRLGVCLAALAVIGGCDARAPGRELIADRCVRGGAEQAHCDCLAKETDRRLDDEMFDLVVRAARGDADTAEDILAVFEPEEQLTYSKLLQEVVRTCGVGAAAPTS